MLLIPFVSTGELLTQARAIALDADEMDLANVSILSYYYYWPHNFPSRLSIDCYNRRHGLEGHIHDLNRPPPPYKVEIGWVFLQEELLFIIILVYYLQYGTVEPTSTV
jgi:hypothetical protein